MKRWHITETATDEVRAPSREEAEQVFLDDGPELGEGVDLVGVEDRRVEEAGECPPPEHSWPAVERVHAVSLRAVAAAATPPGLPVAFGAVPRRFPATRIGPA